MEGINPTGGFRVALANYRSTSVISFKTTIKLVNWEWLHYMWPSTRQEDTMSHIGVSTQ